MNYRFIRNVILKGLLLFLVINFAWALFEGTNSSHFSLYNGLLKGRERLPYGDNPAESYNLSLYDIDAMLASHRLNGTPKRADEYRVIVLGDSSTWGTLLRPEETLAGLLDAAGMQTDDGRQLRFYNLGYPTLSLVKDLMILEEAMRYAPDLILWPVTLESFPRQNQLESPIVANNSARVNALISNYSLNLTPLEENTSFWQRTLIGQRRALADRLRLQIYGVMWSATGIDQAYPADYTPAQRDLENNEDYYEWAPPEIPENGLAFDLVSAGMRIAGEVPVILVNEPMLVSEGENSNIRYNYYYPRWVYDEYRQAFNTACSTNGWTCLDLWDAVPQEHFTNTAIHRDAYGEALFAQRITESGLIP
jgi:hypothetical protein